MDIEEVLHRQLFGPLTLDKFEEEWTDNVSDTADEACVALLTPKLPKLGKVTVYLFASGYAALETSRGKWYAFESLARAEEREYLSAWASFIRGGWTKKLPQEPGTYPTRDLEGNRSKDRILVRTEGRLRDATCCSGFVQPGTVTNWRGEWYSSPYPKLKGAS